MYDLAIVNGTIIDGTGAPGRKADIGVIGGRIAAIGAALSGKARETIDASGMIVTPGFIDGHTHYDAQVSWDERIEPSASHGVTTAIMGNCGVGFAPAHACDRDRLIDMMEGVEDIPGTALHEGLQWDWESFPDYMDALSRRRYALDVAPQIPHAPLRLYVMGDRALRHEAATAADIEAMARLVKEALDKGATGFSTSRVLEHQAASGDVVPGTYAAEDELMALAGAVRAAGRGVFQVVPGGAVGGGINPKSAGVILAEIELLARIALNTGVTVIFSLMQPHDEPETWREVLAICERVRDAGGRLLAMVGPRAPGSMQCWGGYNLFQRRETYLRLGLDDMPHEERLAELRKPGVRAAILADRDVPPEIETLMTMLPLAMKRRIGTQYVYGDAIDYEPTPETNLAALAAASGTDIDALAYDTLMAREGQGQLFGLILNYAHGNYDAVREMLAHPLTLVGLSDAGAHVRVICDASNPTFSLTFWARDRSVGATLPLEEIVRKHSGQLAEAFGLVDRGTLTVGKRADINVIDLDNLRLLPPYAAADLPLGGSRLLQHASGYVATIVNGVVTRRNDHDTGARPGVLVRQPLDAATARAGTDPVAAG